MVAETPGRIETETAPDWGRSIKPLEGASALAPDDALRLTRQALSQLRESVVITDTVLDEPGPHIVYVNAAFTRMTGWTAEEVIGKSPRFLQGPKTTRKTLDRLRTNLESGQPFVGEDINYRKDGSEFYIDWYIEPLRNAQGEVVYYVAVQRDVTERRMLEEQLLHAQRLEGIGLLASGIAHDLNNIFAPMVMAPQLLRRKLANPKDTELLNLVETSARRGVDLVKQILVFAREGKTAPVRVQPREVIAEVANMAGHTFPRTVKIVVDAPADTSLVEIDSTQLYQLLLNLCVNARDAMGDSGTVTMGARNVELAEAMDLAQGRIPAGQYVLLTVTDTGSGIPAAILEKIFQPFFTSKEAGKGTGLGLSTVSIVVKNAHGGLDVQSEIGKGSTFSAYLPAARPVETAPPQPLTIPRARTARSILMVSGEVAVGNIMQEALKAAGHTVAIALSNSDARVLIWKNRYDLALVDLAIGGEAIGAAACELHAGGMPVIGMSGATEADASHEALALDGVIKKPFMFSELLAAIDQLELVKA